MKIKLISIIIIIIVISIIVGITLVIFNNCIKSDDPIVTINCRWSSSFISDVGSLTNYYIYKDGIGKYRYSKEENRVTVDGPSEFVVVDTGDIKSIDDFDNIFGIYYDDINSSGSNSYVGIEINDKSFQRKYDKELKNEEYTDNSFDILKKALFGSYHSTKKSDDYIAVINVRYKSNGLYDTGSYNIYKIFKNGNNKYKYTMEESIISIEETSDYVETENGKINSKEDLDRLLEKIYQKEKGNNIQSSPDSSDAHIDNYVYIHFTYGDDSIGESSEETDSYDDRKEIQNEEYEEFKKLLF